MVYTTCTYTDGRNGERRIFERKPSLLRRGGFERRSGRSISLRLKLMVYFLVILLIPLISLGFVGPSLVCRVHRARDDLAYGGHDRPGQHEHRAPGPRDGAADRPHRADEGRGLASWTMVTRPTRNGRTSLRRSSDGLGDASRDRRRAGRGRERRMGERRILANDARPSDRGAMVRPSRARRPDDVKLIARPIGRNIRSTQAVRRRRGRVHREGRDAARRTGRFAEPSSSI